MLNSLYMTLIQRLYPMTKIWRAGDLYPITLEEIYEVVKNYSTDYKFNDNSVNGHLQELLFINFLEGFKNDPRMYYDLLFYDNISLELKTRALSYKYNPLILHNSTIDQCERIKKGKEKYSKDNNFAIISYLFTQFRHDYSKEVYHVNDVKDVVGITAFVIDLDVKKIVYINYNVYNEYVSRFGKVGGYEYTADYSFISGEVRAIESILC